MYGCVGGERHRLCQRPCSGAALQSGSPAASAPALAALAKEDVPAWRATLLELLAPRASEPAVRSVLEAGLHAADPLERAAAVRGLGRISDSAPLLRPLLQDPVRLVRIDAAWALSTELPEGSPQRVELDSYLRLGLDQPSGLARLGMDLANRGRLDGAMVNLERASIRDSRDSELNLLIAQILVRQGKTAEAAERYLRAAQNRPDDAESAYRAALTFADAGLNSEAEKAMRLCLQRDPARHRAWYNLGLLLVKRGMIEEALEALSCAEQI
ncbi:hypothetical protein EBZ70_03580 [bacterium]|nr:hypothetical protein [bacterium]